MNNWRFFLLLIPGLLLPTQMLAISSSSEIMQSECLNKCPKCRSLLIRSYFFSLEYMIRFESSRLETKLPVCSPLPSASLEHPDASLCSHKAPRNNSTVSRHRSERFCLCESSSRIDPNLTANRVPLFRSGPLAKLTFGTLDPSPQLICCMSVFAGFPARHRRCDATCLCSCQLLRLARMGLTSQVQPGSESLVQEIAAAQVSLGVTRKHT